MEGGNKQGEGGETRSPLFAAREPVPAVALPAASAATLDLFVQPHARRPLSHIEAVCLFSNVEAVCLACLSHPPLAPTNPLPAPPSCPNTGADPLARARRDRPHVWHAINLSWPQPRGGIRSINVMSLHIDHNHAKSRSRARGRWGRPSLRHWKRCPEVGFVTGDYNGACTQHV